MRKNNFKLITAIAFLSTVLFTGCKKNEVSNPQFTLQQSELDTVSTFIKSATGGTFAHGGPSGISPDSTIREVYSSISSLTGDIPVGTIVAKKTFKKGPDGNNTSTLFVTTVMVKKESGYDPDHKDWEYIKIPFNNTVDYNAHPFGILPPKGDTRGKISSCIGCHAGAPGGGYLY